MNQLSFDLSPPLSRATDPLESFQAADRVKEFKLQDQTAILSVLKTFGPGGADFIGGHCGRPGHAIGKRLKEMADSEQIILTGRDVKSDSGRNQREWRIVQNNS